MALKLTKRKGFNFFRSYYDVYNELDNKSKVQFIDALLDRQFLGTKPDDLKGMASFAYISQTNSIDSQVKGYEDKTNTKLSDTPTEGVKEKPITPTLQVKGKGKGKEQEEVKVEVKTKTLVYSNEVHACYDKCLISFEKHLHPKNEKEKLNWLDTIDKLNRIDGIELDLIARITKHIRKDAFWAKNFLSLNKLRKNNKDGIMFIVVFHEQLKSKSNGQQETTASSLSDAHRRFKEGTVN